MRRIMSHRQLRCHCCIASYLTRIETDSLQITAVSLLYCPRAVRRWCGLFLCKSHVAWSVRTCVGHTVSSATTTELIEMAFGGRLEWAQRTLYKLGVQSPRERALLGGYIPTQCKVHGLRNAGYATAMWSYANLLSTFVTITFRLRHA